MYLSCFLEGPREPSFFSNDVLDDILSQSFNKNGDLIAIEYENRKITYDEVNAITARLAWSLKQEGVSVGDVVGLWLPRGAELLLAQIAITRAGAAWLPFDADAPTERVAECLKDAKAKGIICLPKYAETAAMQGYTTWSVEKLLNLAPPHVDHRKPKGLNADHPAYMIYTSGSTGKPKGIVISHRNICHFLRSANSIYGINNSDTVFQGASVAFDLSMEEIWIPLMVGAKLYVAGAATLGETESLPDLLVAKGITVLDTVPTLLSLLPKDIPTLRLIILGGEACPPSLLEKWCRPGRRVYNSYGPTEATVVATLDEIEAKQTVTIGTPLPNYTTYIVDDNLQPVEAEQTGELLIGGPGVAQGYLERPDLTSEKFIVNPFRQGAGDDILYRSGDAVSLSKEGKILFHGRIDDQVKIRGFRVELGEIETRLTNQSEVKQAAVVVRQDHGIDQLVAFIVQADACVADPLSLRTVLQTQLPAYMVPTRYEIVEQLPRLSSGKIDRKTLKTIELSTPANTEEQEEPRTPTEAVLLEAAKNVFPGQSIPFEADFFTDLGGHSLLAARFVSQVRQSPNLASLTLQDMYDNRNLRAISHVLEAKSSLYAARPDFVFEPAPLLRRFLCGLAQAIALPFIFALLTAQWLGVFVSYMIISGEGASLWQEIATLMTVYVVINVVTFFIGIGAKWLILGRTKPGRYPLWGVYYFRWWLAKRLIKVTKAKLFQGSFMARAYYRMLGAKIAPTAYIADIETGAPDLLTIGEHVTIGSKARFGNVEVVGQELVIGTIAIEKDAYIGTAAVIGRNVTIGEGAELGDVSSVMHETTIGAWEKWDGSPARKIADLDPHALPEPSIASHAENIRHNTLVTLLLLVIPPLGLIPIIPAFYVFDKLDAWFDAAFKINTLYVLPLIAWPTAMALIVFEVLLIVALRWAILPVVREGRYSIHSGFYLRKWTVSLATEVVLDTLTSLFATIYMRKWYQLMGAKIGAGSELSINLSGRYDLVDIGKDNFLADEVLLGDEDIRRGWMELKTVKTGDRVFVGNDSVVPPGATIEDGTLIGVKSRPPALHTGSNETWFGSPPLKFPNRQTFNELDAVWTYKPSFWRVFSRGLFEALHTSMPMALFITLGSFTITFIEPYVKAGNYAAVTGIFFAAGILISLTVLAIVCAIKWLLMGAYKPIIKPMWSWWAMRTEAVAVMCWGLSGKIVLEHLRGTPFMAMFLRPFGMKIGKGCFIDTTDFTEFDCMEVGDFCALNGFMCLQTHLYEDRVMKVGRIKIGNGVYVGTNSTILYDTVVGDYARLAPMTLVMKGEQIPPQTAWCGSPAKPVSHQDWR